MAMALEEIIEMGALRESSTTLFSEAQQITRSKQ